MQNNIKHIESGQIITNEEIISAFKCAPRGGMRRSHKTNSLILISDHTGEIYEDRLHDDVFYYTGEGLRGDQDINARQNKTLAESNENKINVHLFEVFIPGKYLYHGKVKLIDAPFQEMQLDERNNIRKVWIFPLKRTDGLDFESIPEPLYKRHQERKERKVKKLSESKLHERIAKAPQKPPKRKVSGYQYQGNLEIKEKVKRLAQGKCDLCRKAAPFKDKNGKKYLEGHHIVWLSNGGLDILDNVVALCPNCHRKMHILNLKKDMDKLKETVVSRKL
jgi:5-methylcytosine-specific restriction protein A